MTTWQRNALRWSLVFVWLSTAVVSLLELSGQSRALLVAAGVQSAQTADAIVIAGAGVDLLLGLLLAAKSTRWLYLAAFIAMLAMTLAATILLPALWLHPLGPLTKNIPIAAILWILARTEH